MYYTTTISGIVTKFDFALEDAVVQLVLVKRPDKNIICYPSQIGCALGCVFCLSKPWVRSLGGDEIVSLIKQVYTHIDNDNKTLLSCMGEGEIGLSPYRSQIINLLKYHFPNCSLAVSTTGIGLSFFREMGVFRSVLKIQLSLHAVTTQKRLSLMPLDDADVDGLVSFFNTYPGRKEINYLLIDGVNDSDDDAKKLFELSHNIPIKINKLSPNPNVNQSPRVEEFISYYNTLGGEIEYYETDGVDIAATCGMLTHQLLD